MTQQIERLDEMIIRQTLERLPAFTSPTALLDGVWLDFNGRQLLADVSMSVMPGETTIITGHSGSGKSTILRLMQGLVVPDRGLVTVNGVQASAKSPFSGDMAVVQQRPNLIDTQTPYDNVVVAAQLEEKKVDHDLLERIAEGFGITTLLGVAAKRSRHGRRKNNERTSSKGLSGGERARVALARALITKPGLLLLDEPTSPLDESNKKAVHNQLAEILQDPDFRATAVVEVSHDQHSLPPGYATRVLTLADCQLRPA